MFHRGLHILLRISSPLTAKRRPLSSEPDTVSVQLDTIPGLNVQCVRDARARHIKLSVNEQGARLTLPLRGSMQTATRFLHQHQDWLAAQWHRYRETLEFPLFSRHARALPLRGRTLPVECKEGRYLQIEPAVNALTVHAPEQARDTTLRGALRRFYEAEARADIGRWIPKYLPELPHPPTRLRIKPMSSQWGSLAPNGTLALDLALILCRPSAFEYVLVHELCHLLQANHSPAFWHEVEQRFPLWREERDYFREHGRRIKATLHCLLNP
jgi:predicted metal-dependent hydrolase